METSLEIIGVPEIMGLYGFSYGYTYDLLHQKGCPVLPRKRNQKIRVIKSEFEKWLMSQKVR